MDKKIKENNSYSKLLSISKLRTGISTQMAFIYFCMGKNYYEKANQVLGQIYNQYNYNSTDAFYIYLVKLSCIENKEELMDFKKTITAFHESSFLRKKSYEISYGYVLLALVNFHLCQDVKEILDLLENAIKYSKKSGRINTNLIMQFAYIDILMGYSSDINDNNRDNYIKKISEILDEIEFMLTIYDIELFQIKFQFKKLQYLVLIGKKDDANKYWFGLRNHPICRKYYLNLLNEILK